MRRSSVMPTTGRATTEAHQAPLQNRVDPWGHLHAVDERGAWLGNRGNLHDGTRRVVRAWARKPWVTCELTYGERRRIPFGPGSYSELFFLDEATAFAAGHRPCATCRRKRYDEFTSGWLRANRELVWKSKMGIADIDDMLHRERVSRAGGKVAFEAPLEELPVGTFIELDDQAILIWHGGLRLWSFAGYDKWEEPPAPWSVVRVLTPGSIVRVFEAGLVPQVHPSADA